MNPFTGITVGTGSFPTFADIDRDGDQDLIVGVRNAGSNDPAIDVEKQGAMYFENTGSASNPVFTIRTADDNPFRGVGELTGYIPFLADLDGDGFVDLLLGGIKRDKEVSGVSVQFFRNEPYIPYRFATLSGSSAEYISEHPLSPASDPFDLTVVGSQIPGSGNPADGGSYQALVDLDGDGDLDMVSPSVCVCSCLDWTFRSVLFECTVMQRK